MDQHRHTILSDREADSDLLDFAPYTNTLLEILRDPETPGPLTIGLFGTWGSGKTSLMRFVQKKLAEDPNRNFRIAWFDAWKYEKEDALWRALLLRVTDSLRNREGAEDKTPGPLKSQIERLEQGLYRDVEWQEKGGLTLDWSKLLKGAATGAVRLSLALVLPPWARQSMLRRESSEKGGTCKNSSMPSNARSSIIARRSCVRSSSSRSSSRVSSSNIS